jgi:hypothetical protein
LFAKVIILLIALVLIAVHVNLKRLMGSNTPLSQTNNLAFFIERNKKK